MDPFLESMLRPYEVTRDPFDWMAVSELRVDNETLEIMHIQKLRQAADMMDFGFYARGSTTKPRFLSKSIVSARLRGYSTLFVKDLKLNRTHHGSVLKAKILLPGFGMGGTHLLVQDAMGNNIRASVYNLLPEMASPQQIARQFPEGKQIIFIDPYVKLGNNDNIRFIRVDNPSEVIVLDEEPSTLASQLIDQGNVEYNSKDNLLAIHAYQKALILMDLATCLTMRAQCHFEMEDYEQCYRDALTSVMIDAESPDSEQAWFLWATSLRNLGALLESVKVCHSALTYHESGRIAELLEKIKGEYTFSEREPFYYYPPASLWRYKHQLQMRGLNPVTNEGKNMCSKLKQKAQVAHQNNLLPKAIKLCTQAIEIHPELTQASRALVNLAVVNQALEATHRALYYTQAALTLAPSDVKTHCRRARYNTDLNQFGIAESILEDLKTYSRKIDRQLVKVVNECMTTNATRRSEHENGVFDWHAIATQLMQGKEPPMAEYLSPKMKLVNLQDKGRGFVAQQSIEPGELLMVSKCVEMQDGESDTPMFTGQNLLSRDTRAVLKNLAERASVDDDLLYVLYLLADGQSKVPAQVTSDWRLPTLERQQWDSSRVARILSNVSFSEQAFGADFSPGVHRTEKCVLLLMGSLFNHEDDCNVHRISFGKYFVFRASRAVAQGAELTISYTGFRTPVEMKDMLQSFGIEKELTSEEVIAEFLYNMQIADQESWLKQHPDFESPHAVQVMLKINVEYLKRGHLDSDASRQWISKAIEICKRKGWVYGQLGSDCFMRQYLADKSAENRLALVDCFSKVYGFPESVDILIDKMLLKQG